MKKVLILGATGMLGHAMVKEFSAFEGQVIITKRPIVDLGLEYEVEVRDFDAESDEISQVAHDFGPNDFIINCIGLVKAHINESYSPSVQRAVSLNALFPHKIQEFVSTSGTKVIQIATDCVFSGIRGGYLESDLHDASDVYGKTKSLGEVSSAQFMNIRVSIIGPEISGHTSLYDWVRFQPNSSQIAGYSDHIWNGITTLSFGRIVKGLIVTDSFRAGTTHVLPSDELSKAELVTKIAESTSRHDIKITARPTGNKIDRTLRTENSDFNKQIWRNAGYGEVPSIGTLLAEISQ